MPDLDRSRLTELLAAEQATYTQDHPRSRELFEQGSNLFGRVPMTWMNKWSGGFPLYLDHAPRATGSPTSTATSTSTSRSATPARWPATPRAPPSRRSPRGCGDLGGITTMLPTADAEWVGAELTRRFGLPLWSFTLTATDANRWAIRLARLVTGRPKILIFAYCYHGSVDETFAVPGPDGEARRRPGQRRPAGAARPTTTRVASATTWPPSSAQLAHGDVAAILTEPALTNIGIVLPEPGFLDGPARAGHAATARC